MLVLESLSEWFINIFTNKEYLGWIVASIAVILFIVFFVLFLVKAKKLHRAKSTLMEKEASRKIEVANKDSEIDSYKSKFEALKADNAALEANIDEKNTIIAKSNDEIATLKEDISKKDAEIADLKLYANGEDTRDSLEPTVTPDMVTEEKAEEKKVVTPRPKDGMYAYTLAKLNEIGEALGIGKKKTKTEAVTMIKFVLTSGKVTKAQLSAAMKTLYLPVDNSLTKDALIEQLRKELTK